MKRTILFLSLLIFSGIAVHSQEFSSLEDICTYALEHSLEYRQALLEAVKAGHDIDGIIKLDETSFSFSGGYDDTDEEWTSTASAELPLLDQLSVTGAVSQDYSRKLGLSFTPLFHSDDRSQQRIALRKAETLAKETALTAENTALSAVLNWMVLTRQLESQEKAVSVSKTIYQDEKVRYDSGESSLDDVRDAFMDWTEAEESLGSLQVKLYQAEADLTSALNIVPDEMETPPLDKDTLEENLNLLKLSVLPDQADAAGLYEVQSAIWDVTSAEKELDDTWLFDPSLSLDSSVILDEEGSDWEASLQFGFSLLDWQAETRQEMKADLELLRQQAWQTGREKELALQQALTALNNTARSRENAATELEQSRELYEEADYLFGLGEYSEAERDDAALTLESSEISLFDALAGEYLAWREIMLYLP